MLFISNVYYFLIKQFNFYLGQDFLQSLEAKNKETKVIK